MEQADYQLSQELKRQYGQYVKMAEAVPCTSNGLVYVISLKHKRVLYISQSQLLVPVVDTAQVYSRGMDYIYTLMEESEAEQLHTAFHRILADYKQVPENHRDNYHIYLNNVLQKGKKKYMLFNKLSVLSHSADGQPDVLWCVARVGKHTYLPSIMAGVPGTEHFRNYSFTDNAEVGVVFIELTDGERTMLSLAQCGYSVAEIAQAMNRTEDTVKFYRRQIFRKFEVDTISEAVAYAENNYFSSGERHRYFKLKERKDTDGLGLFGGKYRRSSFDVFTESVLGLIRSVTGHG